MSSRPEPNGFIVWRSGETPVFASQGHEIHPWKCFRQEQRRERESYAYAAAGLDPLVVMAETPAKLETIVAAMTPEQLETRSAAGKWNLREVLAHLADCELAFGFRLRQVRGGERAIQPFDQDAWAKAYSSYSAAQAMQTFAAMRAWNLAFLNTLAEEEKLLPAHHPERGEMTLWTIVETIAGHDRHHLAKL